MHKVLRVAVSGLLSTIIMLPIGYCTDKYIVRTDGIHKDIDGAVYAYEGGELVTGKAEIEHRTYYFSEEGQAVKGWLYVNGKPMYFDEKTGEALTGEKEVSGTTYNFGVNGEVQTGWQEDGKYYDSHGFEVTNTVVKEDGVEKTIDEKGTLLSGWQTIDKVKYYYLQDGTKATGETTIGKKKYFFQEDGQFLTGWVVVEVEEEAKEEEQPKESVKDELLKEEQDQTVTATISTTVSGEEPQTTKEEETKTEVEGVEVEEEKSNKEEEESKQGGKKTTTTTKKRYYNDMGYLVKDKLETIDGKKYAFDKDGFLLEKSTKEYYVDSKTKEARKMSEWEQEQEEQRQEQERLQKQQQEQIKKQQQTLISSMSGQVKESGNSKDLSAEERSLIASSALAQASVNRQQDCTMLATNALASVGISFHGWPADYASLGRWVSGSEVQPGDLAIYNGHIAVVSGKGTAVHGGFNGSNTVNYSVGCSNPLIGYIRVQK